MPVVGPERDRASYRGLGGTLTPLDAGCGGTAATSHNSTHAVCGPSTGSRICLTVD
jgi:hypothetical protein